MAGFATTLRQARAQKIIDAIDAGGIPGLIKFYTATRPSTGVAISTQTLLGTCMFDYPCGVAVDGVITFNSILNGTAVADGTAVFARITDSNGTFVADLSVGTSGSEAEIIINSTTIVTNGQISVTSATITEGNI
jgi:hypothetical protein